jgi:hypothetical protein
MTNDNIVSRVQANVDEISDTLATIEAMTYRWKETGRDLVVNQAFLYVKLASQANEMLKLILEVSDNDKETT